MSDIKASPCDIHLLHYLPRSELINHVRLLAQSRSNAVLSIPVWEQAVKLDEEVERRLQAREDKLQMPTIDL